MFQKIFGKEAPLWQFLGKALRLIALSCLWILCSLPVLTMASASIALYSAITKHVRPGVSGAFGCFFRVLWKNLLKGILTELLWLFVAIIPIFGYLLFVMQTGFSIMSIVYCFTLMIPLVVLSWLVPLISRYGYGFWEAHKLALDTALRHILQSLVLVLLVIPLILLCVIVPYLIPVAPGLLCLLQSFITEKVFVQSMDV